LSDDDLELYGKYKAKISLPRAAGAPPKAGSCSSPGSIQLRPAKQVHGHRGVTQALRRLARTPSWRLREPSLGPVFGVKAARGGGYAQVVRWKTSTCTSRAISRIASAHNLLSAMLDAHLHHGNALGLDVRRIIWAATIDMNDRRCATPSWAGACRADRCAKSAS